ncbi:hypothetical protein K9U39_18850 [Rhodoblastus acidophilus]|uniref:Uncharacterized protein n=1 Tax=Candidatus Rhodoblastus alkanivorans TaxID=2954117 RepID=A0ABS9Z4C1_9HYPH|nr:hypothetical protein [Candidatus Rhodoblastus alkanivorans]MCI4677557.1 hypothetical protein [Candidatus Rhodoblastus alkanivorans]MCI4681916.1 hypothetical protein [Candidatus Rhodoblastus alkanivorans]MDI4642966.1 hypothetical protein [Rhodoblastus acidophilus]
MAEQQRPPIPLIDVAPDDEPAVAALRAEPGRLGLLLASARRTYTPLGLRSADKISRAWARRAATPLREAIEGVDRAMGRPGAYLLNYSYEWGCTSGAAEDPGHGGPTLLRTLDWPFDGLGRALVATRRQGVAGSYVSLTWPGYAGVLTGFAPGRFAAAINQPPLPGPFGKALGWPLARWRVGASRETPPSHLLRLAFDTCENFDAAVALLRQTPICIPAIFTLAGAKPGETVVIERTEHQAFTAPEPAAANHWASCPGPRGGPRDRVSLPRRAAMRALLRQEPDWSLDWMRPPIHVANTRLVMMANPASGRLVAQGFERTGPATALLEIG